MLFEDGRGGLPWLALRDGFRILKANLQMPCGQALLSVSFASSAALEDRTALSYTVQPWLGRPGPTLSGFCPCCRDADTRSETCLSAENVAENMPFRPLRREPPRMSFSLRNPPVHLGRTVLLSCVFLTVRTPKD